MSEGEFEQRLEALEKQFQAAERERDEYRRLYLEMMERCRKLERGLLAAQVRATCRRARRSCPSTCSAICWATASAPRSTKRSWLRMPSSRCASTPVASRPGASRIPEHLPRVDIEVVPPEVQRAGLDAFVRIGEEVAEVVERRPASLVVARIIRRKFVRKDRDDSEPTEVLIGEPPELPIPSGLAGPGLLADTIVKRWQDHLPLNRLEGVYAREGIELARSTMCGWHAELAELAKPLVAAMRRDAFEQPYLCTDATGVLVQSQEKCRTGHFWVLDSSRAACALRVHARPLGRRCRRCARRIQRLPRCRRTRRLRSPLRERRGRRGQLLGACPPLLLQGARVRSRAREGRARFHRRALPDRAHARGCAPQEEREIRQKRSRPIVDSFFSWCDAEADSVLDDTPISDGIRYARNQREGLSRFIDDGRLPIHNNWSELQLRRQAVGRKNWLFVGNDDAGTVNATFTSLLASCQMHRIEPWTYLRDVLCLLPAWPAHDLLALAPVEWSATSERDDVRKLLEHNPFRDLTSG